MKIAIFYHCLFQINQQRLPAAAPIVTSQMKAFKESGLLDAASNFFIGVNGECATSPVTFPEKAMVTYHGAHCKNELRTLRMLEKWLPGHGDFGDDWLVFYGHSKGATRPPNDPHSTAWRECMMNHLVNGWRRCVKDLEDAESVGCHWMTGDATPPGQSIWAGNFFWSRASYLLTLPSMMERDRLKESGIDAEISRHEAEVWIGNGPRLPIIKDYCGPNWDPGKPHA